MHIPYSLLRGYAYWLENLQNLVSLCMFPKEIVYTDQEMSTIPSPWTDNVHIPQEAL